MYINRFSYESIRIGIVIFVARQKRDHFWLDMLIDK